MMACTVIGFAVGCIAGAAAAAAVLARRRVNEMVRRKNVQMLFVRTPVPLHMAVWEN